MELLDYTLAPEVRAFSTPRAALSLAIETDAPYAGFNLTDYCGDTPAHVAECREALCAELKSPTASSCCHIKLTPTG